jgi:hypothetical protein
VLFYFYVRNGNKEVVVEKKVENRSFEMGLTMFPYDYTAKAIKDTKDFVSDNADLVLIPVEKGIPWEESLENEDFDEDVQAQIDVIVNNIPEDKDVLLRVSPFNEDKDDLANDWNVTGNEARSGDFKSVKFSDKNVIKAYTNYIVKLVELSNAETVIYAPDINLFLENNNDSWADFEKFSKSVYSNLKEKYPEKSFISTIQLDNYYLNEDKEKEKLRSIMEYSDLIAVDCFPYAYSKYKSPYKIPEDYFTKAREIDSRKAFAITDTSYIAENFKTDDSTVKGSEEYQKDYIKLVLESVTNENARFVVWSINRDYDELWDIMEEKNQDKNKIFKTWKNTGLLDSEGNERASFVIWKKYLDKKLISSD